MKRLVLGGTAAILLAAISGILYGLTSLAPIELKVLHERAPLFVTLSDGSIQNKYTLKILNKDNSDLEVKISAFGPENMQIIGGEDHVNAKHGTVNPVTIFVKVPRKSLKTERQDISFRIEATRPDGQVIATERQSIFIGPSH